MRKKIKISFSLIAHNEENNIQQCLKSIQWADEIIVVDCESTDRTVILAKKYTNKIYYRKNNPNLNINKSYGISKAKNKWIFYIDPDEVVSKELKNEIRDIVEKDSKHSAFKIPRKNFYVFNFLKYGGNYPDNQIRFFKKGYAFFANQHVHEKLIVKGSLGKLKNPLLHYPYHNIKEYIDKLNFYTDFQAQFWYHNGKKINKFILLYMILIKAPFEFIKKYFIKLGFLDGWGGIFSSLTHSYTIIINYFKLYELKNKKSSQ